jgi:hypothetical protein
VEEKEEEEEEGCPKRVGRGGGRDEQPMEKEDEVESGGEGGEGGESG